MPMRMWLCKNFANLIDAFTICSLQLLDFSIESHSLLFSLSYGILHLFGSVSRRGLLQQLLFLSLQSLDFLQIFFQPSQLSCMFLDFSIFILIFFMP